jgi:hypothetical protein
MTTMSIPPPSPRHVRPARLLSLLALCACCLAGAGCSTTHPKPISSTELAEARAFPYFPVYWVGPSFRGHHLAAADGLHAYIEKIGTSVYYGDCVSGKGLFGGGGSCELPLQVTTVIYRIHDNAPLGRQRNIVVRGVPAVVYDEGRSIEIYTGRVTVDIFTDEYANGIYAAEHMLPMNAPGSASGNLPLPVYCPGLSGPVSSALSAIMRNLPGHPCQTDAAEQAYAKRLYK